MSWFIRIPQEMVVLEIVHLSPPKKLAVEVSIDKFFCCLLIEAVARI